MTLISPQHVLGILCVLAAVALFVGGRSPQVRQSEFSSTAKNTARWHAALTLAFVFIAVYGSLVPFNFQSLSLEEGFQIFQTELMKLDHVIQGRSDRSSRIDFGVNFVLLIPVSFFFMGTRLRGVSVSAGNFKVVVAASIVIACCLMVTLSIEFAQVWLPKRVASARDVFAQLLGTVTGIVGWLLLGPRLGKAFQVSRGQTDTGDWISWFCNFYLLGFVVYSLVPFDFILQPDELYHRLESDRVQIWPILAERIDADTIVAWAISAAAWLPVGVFSARKISDSFPASRTIVEQLSLGILIVLAIEVGQFFVMSRYCESIDIVVGTCGIAAGMLVNHRVLSDRKLDRLSSNTVSTGLSWLLATVAWAGAVFGLLCWPFEFSDDADQIRTRLAGYLTAPFASLQRGSIMNAAGQIVRKLMYFSLLGYLGAATSRSLITSGGNAKWVSVLFLVVAIVSAILIELFQATLISHTPDITDTILYLMGMLSGYFVSQKIHDSRRATEQT